MAKIGYIMATAHYDKLEEDRQWMQEYGCVKIVEENDADEKNRPLWKQLMIGSLPDEALVLRKSSEHVSKLQERMIVQLPPVSTSKEKRMDREKTVINLYAAGHPIEEIWKASGFRSRSSVFRILNKHGIKLNRGKHSGPIKKKSDRKPLKDERSDIQ